MSITFQEYKSLTLFLMQTIFLIFCTQSILCNLYFGLYKLIEQTNMTHKKGFSFV
jgi:hypothetical protein